MTDSTNYFAETAMLIRRPVVDVFDAFINPEITTHFWFTKSSGKLIEGSTVNWTWEMFNHSFDIHVLSIVPDKEIIIQWGDDKAAKVYWKFESKTGDTTFVTIKSEGMKGSVDEVIGQVRDATGGFTWVLAGAKAYLEHNINLNLIADRYPKE